MCTTVGKPIIHPEPTIKNPSRNPFTEANPRISPDYEHFSFPHAKKPNLEFPILESGAYTGDGSPGADRVVIGSIAEDYQSAVFCAVLTHDGSKRNGFTECQDDTVNTDGKGSYEGREGWGRGREEDRERKLLERIDL
jgi:hypothetical protein